MKMFLVVEEREIIKISREEGTQLGRRALPLVRVVILNTLLSQPIDIHHQIGHTTVLKFNLVVVMMVIFNLIQVLVTQLKQILLLQQDILEEFTVQIQTILKDQMMDQVGQLLQNGIDIMLVVQDVWQLVALYQILLYQLIKTSALVLVMVIKDIQVDI